MASPDNRTKRTEGKLLELWTLTPETRRAAARTVAHHAEDVNDCDILLQMLGLTPQEGGADITRALERGM